MNIPIYRWENWDPDSCGIPKTQSEQTANWTWDQVGLTGAPLTLTHHHPPTAGALGRSCWPPVDGTQRPPMSRWPSVWIPPGHFLHLTLAGSQGQYTLSQNGGELRLGIGAPTDPQCRSVLHVYYHCQLQDSWAVPIMMIARSGPFNGYLTGLPGGYENPTAQIRKLRLREVKSLI